MSDADGLAVTWPADVATGKDAFRLAARRGFRPRRAGCEVTGCSRSLPGRRIGKTARNRGPRDEGSRQEKLRDASRDACSEPETSLLVTSGKGPRHSDFDPVPGVRAFDPASPLEETLLSGHFRLPAAPTFCSFAGSLQRYERASAGIPLDAGAPTTNAAYRPSRPSAVTVSPPPHRSNHFRRKSWVRMKLEGLEPVPCHSFWNRTMTVGTPRIWSAW